MSYTVIDPKSRTTRELRKRIPVTPEQFAIGQRGFTSEPDGAEEIYYEISWDRAGLELMARRAASNKSQSCVDGPIKVRIISRNRLAVTRG